MKKKQPPQPAPTHPFNPTPAKLRGLLKKTKLVVFGPCRGHVKSFDVECIENFSVTLICLEVNQGSLELPSWQESQGSEGFTLKNLDASTFDWTEDVNDGTVTATREVIDGKKKKTFVYVFITDFNTAARLG